MANEILSALMFNDTALSPLLDDLHATGQHSLLSQGLKGIEKESLRIANSGKIAQTDHPIALGSALTHPYITTDYSEALLEFITPPFCDIQHTLAFMDDIHQFVYAHLDNEILLASSMPCGIDGDESIRIAEYGRSNIGQMKHIYRRGLWHRYGRTMQAIAGVHFNYSVPLALWDKLYQQQNSNLSLNEFIAQRYFDLIRNFQRQGWLILYLFGASPAICKQFFNSRPQLRQQFAEFDADTLYHPFATSLRMSDIGYKSENQASLNIQYNHLDAYVNSLSAAINTPYSPYEKIGVKVAGEYQQLNANLLQIENEFYSTIRPKQITESGEKPTVALKKRGIRYVEVRSLDLDIFNPRGISENTCRFVEAFLLYCLFSDSPLQQNHEYALNNQNQLTVANQGRKPGVLLNRNGESMSLKNWAETILHAMQPLCVLLDADNPKQPYQTSLALQQQRVDNPDLTPSAQILQQMQTKNSCFGKYSREISQQHAHDYKMCAVDLTKQQSFAQLAQDSLQQQQQLEMQDSLNLDDFLAHYFAQH